MFDKLSNESLKQKTSKPGGGWFGRGAGMNNTSGPRQKGRLFAPGITDRFNAFGANAMNPEFDYNLKTGIQGWGRNIGKVGSVINTGANVIGALGELGNMSDEGQRTDDLSSDILTAAMSNPLSTYGLTPDQLRLLGDLRSGRFDNSAGISDIDWGGGLRDGLTGALIGLSGGIPGAIAGGLTGLAKGGLGGLTNAKARKNAELEALYQALNQSNTNYQNAMRSRMMERYF
jgi:hypothetical protein